ncbi:3-deoxy-manno-octulosonate cytidylyltransferase [Nitrosomonas sp. Nm34]|uniref:3-deoxy-manno-octulosonate cytidylyltransferase n=1 Tax=Nitrosomonas sp. Nm34 TaxID=1881055 RepID=UPI0008E82920|nr:3-deoxy-manno-octulosonate cytidylyltransferase [Nitrosomonas sp. Nm34]SFI20863.1 3-deoxy-manno-octulosonate cytidylyltransferase (CMP-KDO synthetase) [Nitrosomonas sp. Nm34]
MKTIAIIPARMGSSRFPGKPLAKLLGRTMLEHVYKRVALSDALDATYIATCDEEIQQTAEAFGASVLMTSDKHERASDRVAEAITGLDAELIVMVQGDEPMTHPRMIDTAVAPFRTDPQLGCVNLVRRIENEADFYDVNTIKVIMNQRGDALYMSRQPIPTLAKSGFVSTSAYKQVCIIPFTRAMLLHYTQLPATPLEQLESIDMLRLLEHNIRVKMVETEFNSQAVDTEADLTRVSKLMESDPLLSSY